VAIQRIAYVGLCVADLERAQRFYRDGLGFEELTRLEAAGSASARILQVPGADVQAVFLERDGMRIELLHFVKPGAIDGPSPRPMNLPGLTHFAVRVDDIDQTIAALSAAGGTLLEDTRVDTPAVRSRAAIVLDPDGTRLELIEAPGDPAAPMGVPVR